MLLGGLFDPEAVDAYVDGAQEPCNLRRVVLVQRLFERALQIRAVVVEEYAVEEPTRCFLDDWDVKVDAKE